MKQSRGTPAPTLEHALARFADTAAELGFAIAPSRQAALGLYAAEVAGWRGAAQLTSARRAADVVDELMVPALYALVLWAPESTTTVVDLGCGSGSTAVALWAAAGTGSWVLVDRSAVKVTFCRFATKKAAIPGFRTVLTSGGPGDKDADAVLLRGLPAGPGSDDLAATYCRPGGTLIKWLPGEAEDWSEHRVQCGTRPLFVAARECCFT